jgi:uncharacterized integral membrane protein (TIGR00698 family)
MADRHITGRSATLPVLQPVRYFEAFKLYGPGILIVILVSVAAFYFAEMLNAPSMLFAMIAGMLCHFVITSDHYSYGIEFAAKQVLRIGVALLGAKIVLTDVAALGLPVIMMVVAGVAFTLIAGLFIGRLFGLRTDHSVLSAGSVAICGASAALAISSVLGQDKDSEKRTTVTIIGVTTLSTIVMILYPIVTEMMGFNDQNAGFFIGATIHDVAQVMGAGYMVSDAAGDTAAIVKLTRVACLVPAVFIIGFLYCRSQQQHPDCVGEIDTKIRRPLIPGFLIAFVGLMAINSSNVIPNDIAVGMGKLSGWCLLIAVTALGMKTSFREIASIGFKPVLVLTLQTILLGLFILGGILFTLPSTA